MTNDGSALSSRLCALLDDEAAALRAGALDRLGVIATEKDGLIAALARAEGLTPMPVQALRMRADRNAALLVAARQGVQAARTRVRAVLAAASQLQTYDGAGQVQALGRPASSFERKR